MSNARDKANIPSLNFSSTGIDDNATSTAITIDSSEKVGINSTAPSSDAWTGARTLVIKETDITKDNGITIISSSATNNGNIAFADTSGGGFSDIGGLITYLHNGDSFRFMTANTERMRLNSTGLGIGTSSPSEQLEISGTGTQTLKIDRTDASTAGAITINSANDSNYIYNLTSKNLVLGTNNSARMTIDGSGRVGIGTNSPNYKLSISENANNFLQFSQGGDASAGSLIGRSSSKDLRIQNSENANTVFWTNNTERMRIDSSGNLGIGTTDINTNGISLSRTQGGITRAFYNVVTDYVEFTGELVHATGSGNPFGTQDMIQINFPAPTFSSVFFDIQIMSYTANTGNSATQGSMWRFVFTRDNDDDNANSITEYSTTSVLAGDADPNVSLSGSYSSNVFTLRASQQTGGISHLNFKVTGFVTRVDNIYASDGQTNVSWDGRKKLVYDR